MGPLAALFRRTGRPAAALHVKSGDAFGALAERLGVTAREAEIIRLLLEGTDSRGIGEKLFISDHTVKNHIHNIYQKLGVKNRVQLVRCFQPALEGAAAPPESGSPAAARRSLPRRLVLPAAALFIVVAAVLIAWRPWGRRPRPAAFPPSPAVAVLDFENLSGDADLDKWKMGIPLLIATDLGQSKHIRTVSDDLVFSALRKFDLVGRRRYTREEFRRLAKEMKADYLINGTLIAAGDSIVVTASLQDARTGETIQTERLECRGDQDLLRKADGLVQLLRARLGRTAAQARDDIDLDIEVLTTSSALAYEYYSEGCRYHRSGDYEQSLLMLQKAVEIDPEFAMAYRMMAMDAGNLSYFKRQSEYMRKAFDLAAKLPENCRERHLIRADYYGTTEATWDLAVEEYKKVLEDHPYDVVASNNLGVIYLLLEDYESASRCADIGLGQGTINPNPTYTKAQALLALDRPKDAVRVLTAYHESFAANRLIYQTLIAALLAAGDMDAAAAALDKAVSVFPDPSWANWKATLVFVRDGAPAARQELRRLFLMEEPVWRLSALYRLALVEVAVGRYVDAEARLREGLELAASIRDPGLMSFQYATIGQALIEQGKAAEAVAEARKAVETAPPDSPSLRRALHVLGRAYVRTGDRTGLEDVTRRLKDMAGASTGRRAAREFDIFQGVMAYEDGRPEEARVALERAAAQFPGGRLSDGLSGLYLGLVREKLGDFAGAAKAYEWIVGGRYDRLLLGDVFPLAVLGLARSREALGNRDEALAGYRRFLELWADADPGHPEVPEARARVAALSGRLGSHR